MREKYHLYNSVERCPACGAIESLKCYRVVTRGQRRADGLPYLSGGEVRRQYKRCRICGASVVVSVKE